MSFTFGTAETVNFDTVTPGSLPQGWSISSSNPHDRPHWQVKLDRTAPSRPNVLAQIGMSGGRDQSIALLDRSACRNGDISVDLKLVSGKLEESAGIIWRYQNPANYYFALASAGKHAVGIYKKENNAVSLVAHASVPHFVNGAEWNLLKVAFRGPRLTLYFGHRKLIEVEDTTFPNGGRAGVWTKADTEAYFDNFRVDKKD
jgi:hypothetical protein